MSNAFISYSRRDSGFVSHLQTELTAAQFGTWRDVHNLRAGDRWPRKLGDAIAAASSFILIWSASAAQSDYFVELEWTTAIALKREICIVALDDTQVPPTLRASQAERTADPKQAARWLLHQPPAPPISPAAAEAVRQTLSAIPDNTSAKQIASQLTIGVLSQSASHVQGPVFQPAGPMTVNFNNQTVTTPPAPHLHCNIASRGQLPFVGRDDLMAELDSLLEDHHKECVVILHGAPGVGKSELAREFGRSRHARYTNGAFLIDASANAFALQFASLAEKALALPLPPEMSLDDRGQRAFATLTQQPVLLIYDNVVSFQQAQPWLPYSDMPCHVLITTLLDSPTQTWPCLEVMPLTAEQSLELVGKLTAGKLDQASAQSIATHADGLPVQILPHAAALLAESRRGRNTKSKLPLAAETGNSFRAAYNQLSRPARLLLHSAAFFNTQHIPSAEITQHLKQGLRWTEDEVERAFDQCFDLHLLQGSPNPRMHQLFATFIRETPLAPEDQAVLSAVCQVQATRFLELAKQVAANPADLNNVSLLLDYPLTPEAWSAMGRPFTVAEGELTGESLYEVGRFDEARPWFERAVAEKEKGDEHGRVDHASLGSSLHRVGYCYSSTGQYEEARRWYQRAVAEKEKGDEHARVDHESLGNSLHQVGYCYSSTGRYEEARPWYERAVVEAEKGDVHRRVDHDSLGRSLHLVGYCYSSTWRYEEARPWCERAVAEKEKGDVHGRVDHESLGTSLHELGNCYSCTGKYEEARPWYERAVAEAEKGDVHGRVDHESLGSSLHLVGDCYSSTGQYDEARPWYERAMAEKEKGDVHGRVDHESLGSSLHNVGYCYSNTGQHEEARPWYERAVAETEKGDVFGRVDKEYVAQVTQSLAECLRELNRSQAARQS